MQKDRQKDGWDQIKTADVQIKIYVKLCKLCKRLDSLKDAHFHFTDLWHAFSNIHEHEEYLPKADTVARH